jgi:RNA polymerase sigma-70 factor (ECF subfamily)
MIRLGSQVTTQGAGVSEREVLKAIDGGGAEEARRRVPASREHEFAIAQRALDGDQIAMRRVLQDVGPSMLRVVRSVLGVSAGEAEDTVQESLIAFVEALPTFRGECGLKHYGCSIATHVALRARRRATAAAARRTDRDDACDDMASENGDPDAEARSRRRTALLRRLLDELPEEQSATLVMRVMLGYSLADVAEATGVPLNTVRSRVRLAKEALRRRIEADPHNAELAEVEP